MSDELKPYKEAVSEIFEKYFIDEVCNKFDLQIKFINDYGQYLKRLHRQTDKVEDVSRVRALLANGRSSLLRLVDTHFSTFQTSALDSDFIDFSQSVDTYIKSVERKTKRPQIEERFKRQPDDSFQIRIGKFHKRVFYAISKWPEKVSNTFRKLFKKPVKELRPWYHVVFLQRLCRFYLKEELLHRASQQMDILYLAIISTSKVLWKLDEAYDELLESGFEEHVKTTYGQLDALKVQIDERKGVFQKKCQIVINDVFDQFEDAYFKAGTIELTNNRFNPRNLKKKHDRLVRKHQRLSRGWNNTVRVMSDDWEIDLELYAIIHSAKAELSRSSDKLRKRIEIGISPSLESLKKLIEDKIATVKLLKESKLKSGLTDILEEFNAGVLAQPAKQTIDIILAQDLPSLLNLVETDIDRGINAIKTKRAVVSKFEYDKPIRSAAISYVSPFELINFETGPQFKKAMQKVKVETTGHINNVLTAFQSLSQIAEFNIESAIALFEDESEDNPKDIALEGLSRTAEKINGVKAELNAFQKLVDEELLSAVDNFNESLIKFTNNENIFAIKVRIARAMAVERSKHLRDRIIKNIKSALPSIFKFVRVNYTKGSDWVSGTFKRYGINAEQEVISTELVDFLAETETSIDKLPFVYQRLFRSQPLEDLSFYESRKTEIQELNHAYNNWTKNRFAPSVVIGEKGSGLTTLLHFAIKEIGSSKRVIQISLDERILVPDDISTFFSNQLGKKFKGLEDLIKFLNEGEKRIIVIENLQRMYLRKVGGFDCLMELLQLITITSRKVFWMAGCTLYAWNYLEKTMKLSEHFGYVVKLKDFDSEQIVSVINKRHQVSGYNITFEPTTLNMNSKRFKNLDDKAQQALLRKQYFDDLNKIAKSNISLALLYWLRSTSTVSESTISISGLRDIDFSFLNSYAQDKLFGLTQLVLHDGLSEKDFMEVSGKSSSGSRNVLYPLYDDGILVEEDGIYSVNPLLYRQVVSLLKAKNILH